MITQVLYCPNCHGTDIVRHGKTPQGKQRYRCRQCSERSRTFLLDSSYSGQSPPIKEQTVDMAMNASGIRRVSIRKGIASPIAGTNRARQRVSGWSMLTLPRHGCMIGGRAGLRRVRPSSASGLFVGMGFLLSAPCHERRVRLGHDAVPRVPGGPWSVTRAAAPRLRTRG